MADFCKRCEEARECKNYTPMYLPTVYDIVEQNNLCEKCTRAFENKVAKNIKDLRDNFESN